MSFALAPTLVFYSAPAHYGPDGHSKEMQGFFRPLMTGAVNLATSVCALAESAGHPIAAVVVCGGPVRNWWFLRQLKTQLQKSLGFHDDAIKDIQEYVSRN